MEERREQPEQREVAEVRHEDPPRALEAGPEPLGDAFGTKLWLARIALIACVVMCVVVFVQGTHPFWFIAFPIAVVWLIVAISSMTANRASWEDLMARRQAVLDGKPSESASGSGVDRRQ